ncbi:hypothetical protein GGF50DRAFT_121259 [Schizophyllum commune]
MTNDLANLRRDFAAVNQALRQAEVQAKSAKDALLRAQGARDKAEARLVDAEKRAALAEARAAAAEKSAALAQERAAAAEGSAASAQERATAAEGSAASAQKRAVVAEERERSALVKLTAATADVTTANARAEDAEARAMAIAENQRIIHAAHAKAELEASQAAAMYKEARKDRDTMEAECVRLRRELDAQSSFISSIRAQVASLPGCLDQQANRDVSTPPLAHAPPNRLPAAALDADSSTEASPGIAISRKVTPMPVTVQGSIDPGDADENESETEAQQQDDLDDSPGEVGGDKHLRGAATPSPPPPTSRTARHIIPLINPARTKHVSYTVPFNSALLVFDRKTWLRLLLSVCDTATAGCIPDGVHENGLSELKQDT